MKILKNNVSSTMDSFSRLVDYVDVKLGMAEKCNNLDCSDDQYLLALDEINTYREIFMKKRDLFGIDGGGSGIESFWSYILLMDHLNGYVNDAREETLKKFMEAQPQK